MLYRLFLIPVLFLATTLSGLRPGLFAGEKVLRAGAVAVDISPLKLPAIRNGGFIEASSNRVDDPLFARCVVVADASEVLAIVVVDSCMLPRKVCDEIKATVRKKIGLPANRILISATHTHSAPSAMDFCLGTRKDKAYTDSMIPRVADGIVAAHGRLMPARVGWATIDAHEFTNCRRWIRRSDSFGNDPFGERTIGAMMHPGYLNPAYVGPSGPIDPELSILSFVSPKNEPICILANYSMHYYGAGGGFSADYYGEFARHLEKELGGGMVGIMSQGTSGDLHWMDYGKPRQRGSRQQYAAALGKLAVEAWRDIKHRSDATLAMSELLLPLGRRLPSAERLEWARSLNERRGQRRPRNQPEVYAEQARWIHENPRSELVLQAIRIGELGICALPNEVYGITGLKLKAQSPLAATFNIELANGAEGYIPPPEQHKLGGYTTWPAATAGLEEQAEPKIVEGLLTLLERVSGRKRRVLSPSHGPYARAVLAARPVAYWRFEDFNGPEAFDSVAKTTARFEEGTAFYLPGVRRRGGGVSTAPEENSPFSAPAENRAVHFAGGRLRTTLPALGKTYSVSMWIWNGISSRVKPVTGYFFSRGEDGDRQALGEHLGISGTHGDLPPGRLFFYTGNEVGRVVPGRTVLEFRDWHHVVLVRDPAALKVYLDGKLEIEEELEWTIEEPGKLPVFIGGRSDKLFGFEGKLDEVAVFDRALSAAEVAAQFKVSERVAPLRKDAQKGAGK
ncbi:MAG: LamG-like jellyroll fold domain-containing protein [Planctomycetota bacterium]|nr:LamG-like jellyroll fold domain-containing protein [Planctomycetota bacterium]